MFKMIRAILPLFLPASFLTGCQAIAGETLGDNFDDTTITTTVKTKLAAEKGSTLTRVQVDTNRGVAQLSGVIDSGNDQTRAG